ncbi:DUF4982 domain-containing protein [Paenibacillus arenilitoris]|uniref:DUF4982 domain-containing protein n=1 Tax=Paenibacillus arenilitoris TaxID=2772299 RepID=A0A927CN41_9BACL|nr:DUF4982 domain-containing protein [Paenibacillus arenilitoris]MBD2870327.1 DUF4982 domain-containing protein [Paenibacillus arenilitoris]
MNKPEEAGRVIYGSESGSGLEAWLAVRDNDAMSAQFIWTGIDYLGEARGWPVRVAQAGFLDLAGFKKTSYHYRRSLWSEEPAVFLAAMKQDEPELGARGRWSGGVPHWNWEAGERLRVACHTNCEEAELFLNGRSLGTRKLADAPRLYLTWEVPFEEGTLEAAAKGKDGKLHSYALHTASKPTKLALSVDDAELKADGQDIAHVEIQVADRDGNPVYLADHPITLSVEGPGEIIGMENGDVQDLEPYSSRTRKAYRGRLLAYVRATTSAGRIVVTAESPGLEPARAAITAG